MSPAHSGRALRTTLRWPVSPSEQVAPGRLPLIVFAHGYDVSAATYSAMLDDLTRAGFVVAAPEFPGESTAYPGPAVETDLVNEPCDMEFVAASLEHRPPAALRYALRDAALVVAGHSDGATAAASAGYASTCSTVPIRAVVALSPDDVPMTGASRFGTPPALLAMTGTADGINPLSHTLALYRHVPTPAWLVTVDRGSHLGTFTTDPDLTRIDAIIADFVFMVADHKADGRARLERTAGGRIHLQSRRSAALQATPNPAAGASPNAGAGAVASAPEQHFGDRRSGVSAGFWAGVQLRSACLRQVPNGMSSLLYESEARARWASDVHCWLIGQRLELAVSGRNSSVANPIIIFGAEPEPSRRSDLDRKRAGVESALIRTREPAALPLRLYECALGRGRPHRSARRCPQPGSSKRTASMAGSCWWRPMPDDGL